MRAKRKFEAYDRQPLEDDFKPIAESLIESAREASIQVEEDPDKLKHMIKTDLRDNIPAQLYALIGTITSRIEKLEAQKARHNSSKE